MRRKLFTLLARLSLLLCVAVCVLWVRSYFVADRFFWRGWADDADRSYQRQVVILSGHGGVGVNSIVQSGERWPANRLGYREAIAQYLAKSGSPPFHSSGASKYPAFNVGVGDDPVWGGFKHGSFFNPVSPADPRPRSYGWQVVVPYWAIVPATAVLPVVWEWRRRTRRRREIAGLCPSCGYDLRATPERCPECGASHLK